MVGSSVLDKPRSQICTSQELLALIRAFIATQTCDSEFFGCNPDTGNITKSNMILFSQAPVCPVGERFLLVADLRRG